VPTEQEVDHLVARDPDLGPPHPPRRGKLSSALASPACKYTDRMYGYTAFEARDLGGHQGRHQVLVDQVDASLRVLLIIPHPSSFFDAHIVVCYSPPPLPWTVDHPLISSIVQSRLRATHVLVPGLAQRAFLVRLCGAGSRSPSWGRSLVRWGVYRETRPSPKRVMIAESTPLQCIASVDRAALPDSLHATRVVVDLQTD
jgi:hypothetical protein